MQFAETLRAAGVDVQPVDPAPANLSPRIDALVDLTVGHVKARFVIETKARAPYPNELPTLQAVHASLADHGIPLLVVPFVSEPLGGTLTQAGWSWADAAGNFDLRTDNLVLRQRSGAAKPRPTSRRLPGGSGSFGLIRELITHHGAGGRHVTPTELARTIGISQPRASQVLRALLDLQLVTRGPDRRWSPEREDLLDRFLSEYPGPGGSERCLYSLDAPTVVAQRVAEHLDERALAVSADVGPDLLVPWRRPSTAILYVRELLDTDQLGLVGAQGRHDANVIVRIPSDTSLFAPSPLLAQIDGVAIPLADPVQQIWDLLDLGGADRLEAAGRLRSWLLEGH